MISLAEYPNAPYDDLLRSAGIKGTGPCKVPDKLPGDPCRALAKDASYRRGGPSITKELGVGGRGKNSAFAGGRTGGGMGGGKSGGAKSGGGGGVGEVEEKCGKNNGRKV